jgi:hypothetical protein
MNSMDKQPDLSCPATGRAASRQWLTRREFLRSSGALVLACNGWSAAAEPEPTRPNSSCRPAIAVTLWWASARQNTMWGRTGWERELEEQKQVGFDLLWLTNAPAILDHPVCSLRTLLDLCDKHKFQVILDTGSSGPWYVSLDLKQELDLCRRNIRRIADSAGDHPAFHAWYIPHEIYMCWDDGDAYIQQLYPALADACRTAAAHPVTLSPFFILDRTKVFGDFRFNEPEEYRDYWTRLIRHSGFDIIMLQDSGEHFSYVTDEQRRPFFQAMSEACRQAGARLWGNVEVAEMECESIEEYVRRYGRVHHSKAQGIPWRPVPLPRLQTKLTLAAEFSERIVSWGYQQFCRPSLGSQAAAWYDALRAYQQALRTP